MRVILLLILVALAHGAESPKFIFKEGNSFAAFDLQQGKQPCKKNSPCLFFHKDNDKLRLIVNGRNIRMAYKNEDRGKIPFPKNFRISSFNEKAEIIRNYRDFFKSEFAIMLQTFVYTVPELFDWDIDKFKSEQDNFLISANELDDIFSSGKQPEFYTILKFKCAGGEDVVFESDANGSFYMEIE